MSKLPRVSGRDAAKALMRDGFELKRQTPHLILFKQGVGIVSIPDHKELDRGALRGIIRDAGLTVREFLELL